MTPGRGSKAVGIWGLLCAFTLLSMMLIEGGWLGTMSSVLIILIAAMKSRLVMIHFMEVSRAARHWRLLYETWNFAATATIVIGYLLGAKN